MSLFGRIEKEQIEYWRSRALVAEQQRDIWCKAAHDIQARTCKSLDKLAVPLAKPELK